MSLVPRRPSDAAPLRSWTEPVFRDNVGVHQLTASYLPGHYFPGAAE